jgi:hypothetical protein
VTARGALLLGALVLAVTALVVVRRPDALPPASAADVGARARPRPAGMPAEPDVDPATIRDVFRFAPRASAVAEQPLAHATPAAGAASPAPELPRLVGLVRRQGRLLAAFAVDGDVVLAGPGEAAAGLTVVEVTEEGVRIRLRDGSEELLALP